MICPHCGFDAPAAADDCPSCGYLLKPPQAVQPRRRSLLLVALVLIALIAGFLAVVRNLRDQTGTSISFFGKRAHYLFPEQRFVLRPGQVESVSLRNPARTPVCRLYVQARTVGTGVDVIVLDSANLDRLRAQAPYRAYYEQRLSGAVDFTAQTEGGDVSNHVAFRYRGPQDSAVVTLDGMRAQCFEKW